MTAPKKPTSRSALTERNEAFLRSRKRYTINIYANRSGQALGGAHAHLLYAPGQGPPNGPKLSKMIPARSTVGTAALFYYETTLKRNEEGGCNCVKRVTRQQAHPQRGGGNPD